MSDTISTAIDNARSRYNGGGWEYVPARERSEAIYQELCRLDSGCQRTGRASDMLLPPCQASATFVARRRCRLAGPPRADA
jgi:hypothetical protein